MEAISEAEKQERVPISSSPSQNPSTNDDILILTPDVLAIKSRLQCLVEIEKELVGRLVGTTDGGDAIGPNDSNDASSPTSTKEVSINSHLFWKGAMNKLFKTSDGSTHPDGRVEINFDDPDDPAHAICPHSHDMMQLWNSPVVRKLLLKEKIFPEQSSGL